jgi:hypothetical protein
MSQSNWQCKDIQKIGFKAASEINLVHIVPGNESFGKIKISTECGSAG